MMNEKRTYTIPPREQERYGRHGIAIVGYNDLRPSPHGGTFRLDLEPLMRMEVSMRKNGQGESLKPAAWAHHGTSGIVISSGKQKIDEKCKPKAYVEFESGREIPLLEVNMDGRGKLSPVYKKEPVAELVEA
jgi:hypothetical protein